MDAAGIILALHLAHSLLIFSIRLTGPKKKEAQTFVSFFCLRERYLGVIVQFARKTKACFLLLFTMDRGKCKKGILLDERPNCWVSGGQCYSTQNSDEA